MWSGRPQISQIAQIGKMLFGAPDKLLQAIAVGLDEYGRARDSAGAATSLSGRRMALT